MRVFALLPFPHNNAPHARALRGSSCTAAGAPRLASFMSLISWFVGRRRGRVERYSKCNALFLCNAENAAVMPKAQKLAARRLFVPVTF